MSYAICIVPLAPLRTLYDHRAEMSSQLIFGEQVKILSVTEDGWAQVECCNDGYIGCCRLNQFVLLENKIKTNGRYAASWVQEIMVNGQRLMIPYGTDLSITGESIPGHSIVYKEKILDAAQYAFNEVNVKQLSNPFLNTAYLWGGRSVFGIDCSGFAQAVYKMMNVYIPRDANQQVNTGESIGFLQEAKCGDLAFFDDEEGKIIHVGILLNAQQIIHSSGNVRIDDIDNEGIIHTSTRKRTHHLRVIKRIKEY